MIAFFEDLPPTVIAIEACGSAHHWARHLGLLGHEVKLIAPQLAKPYVKRGKNDAADAEALCEAMSRPTMRFVPVKTADQQAALMLVGMRDRLVRTEPSSPTRSAAMAPSSGLLRLRAYVASNPCFTRSPLTIPYQSLPAISSRFTDANMGCRRPKSKRSKPS